MENNSLSHWGIKGMKWGVRRYQSKDGSLTPAGKKRYNSEVAKLKEEQKVLKNKEATKKKLAKLESMRKDINEKKKSLDSDDATDSSAGHKKSVKEMTDNELASAIKRAELEKRYRELNPKQVSVGERFLKEAVLPAATQAGKNLIQDTLTKKGKEFLGLKDGDSLEALKKEVDKLRVQKEYKDLKDTAYSDLKKEVSRMTLEKQLKNLKNEADNDTFDSVKDSPATDAGRNYIAGLLRAPKENAK